MSTEVLEGTVVSLEPQKEAPCGPPTEGAKAVDPPIEDVKAVDPPIEDVKAVVQKSELPKAEAKPLENGMNFISPYHNV